MGGGVRWVDCDWADVKERWRTSCGGRGAARGCCNEARVRHVAFWGSRAVEWQKADGWRCVGGTSREYTRAHDMPQGRLQRLHMSDAEPRRRRCARPSDGAALRAALTADVTAR